MTLPGFALVTAEALASASTFYSALSERKKRGDRLVLIRMPADVSVGDMAGCVLENLSRDSASAGTVLGRFSKRKGKPADALTLSVHTDKAISNTSNAASTTYAIARNALDSQLTSVALAAPMGVQTVGTDAVTMGVVPGAFDDVWSVCLDVSVPDPDFEAIERRVQKRKCEPLVAQPQNLRMRVSAVSTPSTRKAKASSKSKSKKEKEKEKPAAN
jgi:hypothetical protein